MHLDTILSILIIAYLRKFANTKKVFPHLDKLLLTGIGISVAIMVLKALSTNSSVVSWLAHFLLIGVVYFAVKRPEFKGTKQILYAVIPYLVVSIIADVAKDISAKFYFEWKGYFETANVFAFLWLIAMWWINRRQKRQLDAERRRAEEKEKQYEITEVLKAQLEVQVAERTAALTQQKEELEMALHELKATQNQLIQSEKMASLGELTAGIAHEIQNPLNFVNNFSEVNTELIEEMKQELQSGNHFEAMQLAADISSNEQKINHHGKRADAIVKGMLQHSRTSNGTREPTDINALADEYLRLAYHGLRAKDKSFNASFKTDFDETIGKINVVPQDLGRAFLNLITNAFYAVADKKKALVGQPEGDNYEPTVIVSTKKVSSSIFISVADNGKGIPPSALDKIFQPFFTTKPTGEGTGLGLSMCYDIITKMHGGELKVETKEGEGSTFIIELKTF